MPILGTIASSTRQGLSTTSYDSIATVTLNSSSSSVSFSSIPSTYKHLQLRIMALGTDTTATNGINIQVNGDTGNNYARHLVQGYSGGVDAYSVTSTDRLQFFGYRGGLRTTYPTVAIIDLFDYTNTNKFKTGRALAGNTFNGNATPVTGEMQFSSGVWLNTNAISSLNVYISGTSFAQYSSFALYGIKGA